MKTTTVIGRWVVRTLLGSALMAALMTHVYAQQQAAATDSQTQAREILMRMAKFLGQAKNFSVNVSTNYDAVQKSGEKIEFSERREVIVNRPGQMRVEAERSDGSKTEAVFTGKDIILIDATNKVYASEPQPDGLDESIVYFVSDLGMRFPLAVLLMSRLPTEFENRVRTVDYVEKTNLLGIPSHHLAARTDTVDFQIWVSDGAQAMPLRVVLTYKKEPGQPQFRAQFANWNFSPPITDTTFSAQVPTGSQKIAFAAQLTSPALATRSPQTNKGGK